MRVLKRIHQARRTILYESAEGQSSRLTHHSEGLKTDRGLDQQMQGLTVLAGRGLAKVLLLM